MLIPSQSNDSSTTLGLAEIPDLTSAGSVVSALSSIGSNSAGHLLPQDMIIPSDTYIMNVIQTCSGLSPTAKSIGVADLRLILNSLSLHQSTHHEVEEEVIGMVADVGAQADMTITADAVEEAADMEEGVVDMEVFGSIGHPKEEGVVDMEVFGSIGHPKEEGVDKPVSIPYFYFYICVNSSP
jgi:hypothetical protein